MSVPEKSFAPEAGCPLDGVRVVDMSRLVSGNMVSLQLADFGAEVIKIEDPKTGDPLRAWQTDGVSVHWKVYSRNKKSVALDLRAARGRELLAELIAGAQVLVENFRPGTLEAMGLAPARSCTDAIPDWLSSGFPAGARTDHTATAPVLGPWSRACRAMPRAPAFPTASRHCRRQRSPTWSPGSTAPLLSWWHCARWRPAARKGQVIDLPLLDPLFSFIATEAAIFRLTGEVRERTGSRSETTSPRNVFRTKDGRYIGISASIQAMAERLFRAIGHEDMIADPRFRTNSDRVKNAAACEAPIVAFIAARTLAENMAIFERAEVTAAPVYDIDQFMADPHVLAREILVDVPDAEIGRLPMHNVIPRLSATPGRLRRPAPGLGEHTAEVLGALGLDRAAIDGLRAKELSCWGICR